MVQQGTQDLKRTVKEKMRVRYDCGELLHESWSKWCPKIGPRGPQGARGTFKIPNGAGL